MVEHGDPGQVLQAGRSRKPRGGGSSNSYGDEGDVDDDAWGEGGGGGGGRGRQSKRRRSSTADADSTKGLKQEAILAMKQVGGSGWSLGWGKGDLL